MMDGSEIGVVAGAVVLVAFVLWYFFGPRKAAAAEVGARGVQEIRVTVKGGYAPDVIAVRAGQPVRLDFYRDETAACSEQVVFRDFGVIRDLPAYETTPVEFTPEEPGEYTFTCGMNMMRGKLVVEPAADAG
jgi:plastocyanin domain-containing protein